MALERWLALGSLGLFAMFAGEMYSVYSFLANVPDDFVYAQGFAADPKILQFISIGAAPAGVLAGVSFIMSRQYGSRPVGGLIAGGAAVLLAGMIACFSITPHIDVAYISNAVIFVPILFMGLSAPVAVFGLYLFKRKKVRPKKEYF